MKTYPQVRILKFSFKGLGKHVLFVASRNSSESGAWKRIYGQADPWVSPWWLCALRARTTMWEFLVSVCHQLDHSLRPLLSRSVIVANILQGKNRGLFPLQCNLPVYLSVIYYQMNSGLRNLCIWVLPLRLWGLWLGQVISTSLKLSFYTCKMEIMTLPIYHLQDED